MELLLKRIIEKDYSSKSEAEIALSDFRRMVNCLGHREKYVNEFIIVSDGKSYWKITRNSSK